MGSPEIIHVVIAPPDSLDPNLATRVAEIIDKDLYRTRLLLASKVPRIAVQYRTVEAAEIAADSLRSLGLIAMAITDSEIRKSSQPFRANTMTLEKQGGCFYHKSGHEKRMESGDISLIIKGRMQTYRETETTTSHLKFSLKATVLTGGIPIWRKVQGKTSDTQVGTENFVWIYDAICPDPRLEIVQSDFDYKCLEAQMEISSLVNFDKVVDRIRDVFPHAIFDARLMSFYQVDIPTTSQQESTKINCKLISLYHQSLGRQGQLA